jgi:CRP/FNR family cyclic AMP-dependent transcriptional regulator
MGTWQRLHLAEKEAGMAEDKLEIRDFTPGETIFSEGEPGRAAYIVESGMVEITKESNTGARLMLAAVKAGEMFGEMALIDASPRMATAIAVGKTRLVIIPKSAFSKLLGKTDVVIRTVLNTLMERLRQQTDRNVKNTL